MKKKLVDLFQLLIYSALSKYNGKQKRKKKIIILISIIHQIIKSIW